MSRLQEKSLVIAVAERLSRASVGEIVSHDAIRLIVGREYADCHWQFSTRAIDLLNKEGGVVFATIRGIGQYRPEKGGSSGRFERVALEWKANRQPAQARQAA